jgi:D-glycero-D-manno-heptose 1,7-bisphosphate phosphatase
MTLRRAAFLDRDGVLNVDHGYVFRPQDFEWLPGAVDALRLLQQAGYALVVVTNQSGVARGFYTLTDVEKLHAHLRAELLAQGVRLAAIYACPHHPDGVVPAYRVQCNCRKPMPGMIEQAAREHGLDLAASCLFGDKLSDVEAGRRAGVGRCWLVGPQAAALVAGGHADSHADSLLAAVQALTHARAL